MITITCPSCEAESKLSFVEDDYEGPRRCWKCHGLFLLKIRDNVMVSCEPMSEEDLEQQQEIAALKARMRNS